MPAVMRFGIEFRSQLEADAYAVALDRQRRGEIRELSVPGPIVIAPPFVDGDGHGWPEMVYTPDQRYVRTSDGRTVYVEVKPPRRRDRGGRLLPAHKQPASWRRDVPVRMGLAARVLPGAIFVLQEGIG